MKRTFSLLTLAFALVLVFFALVLLATPSTHAAAPRTNGYAINWYTMDGGGGTSTNGTLTLTGTIGQPDASAPLSGTPYTLQGGFWSTVLGDVVTDMRHLFLPLIRR